MPRRPASLPFHSVTTVRAFARWDMFCEWPVTRLVRSVHLHTCRPTDSSKEEYLDVGEQREGGDEARHTPHSRTGTLSK